MDLLATGSCDDSFASIANQTMLDAYSKCSELDSVFVSHKFSGDYKLSGVKKIVKFSSGYLGPKLSPSSTREDDPVTSISLPDLETVKASVLLGYLEFLISFSAP